MYTFKYFTLLVFKLRQKLFSHDARVAPSLNGTVLYSAFWHCHALLHVCLWKGILCHGGYQNSYSGLNLPYRAGASSIYSAEIHTRYDVKGQRLNILYCCHVTSCTESQGVTKQFVQGSKNIAGQQMNSAIYHFCLKDRISFQVDVLHNVSIIHIPIMSF